MDRTPEAYTRAILAAVLEPWLEGLSVVESAYQTDDPLRAQLEDATLEPAAKAALLDNLLPASAPQELRNFLSVLATNNDLGFIDEINAGLARVVSEEAGGPLPAVITSAVALGEQEEERIRTRLLERFGANLDFTFQVEPDILGGLVVQVGDKLIDDSVRGRIEALRNSLGVRV